jgi:hypothetical protein
MTDPWIMPDALEHGPHVHTQILREAGDLVRKRESQGEEDIRRVLYEACLFGPHDQERSLGHGKRILHACKCVRVWVLAECPKYDTSGPADVIQGASLSQELRRDEDAPEGDAGPARQAQCRSDGQSAANDARGARRDCWYSLLQGTCDI